MKPLTTLTSLRSSFFASVCAIGFLASGSHASAQNSSLDLVVNIPFEFRSGSEPMPAGRYEIRELSNHYLLLRKSDHPRSQMIPASVAQARELPDHSRLIFNRHGNQYFLHQIWLRGQSTGFEFRMSHAERKVLRAERAHTAAKSELALNDIPKP